MRRSALAQEDFHEKLIVAYAPLENADSDLLSLFWLTLLEWNKAPLRRAKTIIMTDAIGRTGLDHGQAGTHDKNTDWSVVGDSFSETTTGNAREMVNLCDQAGSCLGKVVTIPKPGGSGPDCMRSKNLLGSTDKLLFRYWLHNVLDPYRHWQFGLSVGRGVSVCLAIRFAVWERAYRAGWWITEHFWDVVKAFDMLSRPQLFQYIQSFGFVGLSSDSLTFRSGSNVFCRSLLVSDAYRGQSWPQALTQIFRCRGSRMKRGIGSAPEGATVDVNW